MCSTAVHILGAIDKQNVLRPRQRHLKLVQLQVQMSVRSHPIQLQKAQVVFLLCLKNLLKRGTLHCYTCVRAITHMHIFSRLLKRAPEPPICLCIKTELCDKATLKTWLSEHKYGRKRKYITECFMEVCECVCVCVLCVCVLPSVIMHTHVL